MNAATIGRLVVALLGGLLAAAIGYVLFFELPTTERSSLVCCSLSRQD